MKYVRVKITHMKLSANRPIAMNNSSCKVIVCLYDCVYFSWLFSKSVSQVLLDGFVQKKYGFVHLLAENHRNGF